MKHSKIKMPKMPKKMRMGAKKIMVKDIHDRVFTEAEHGFDLILKAGEAKEVDAKTAALIKKNYSYIEVK